MESLGALLKTGPGDANAGKSIYASRCAACHKLFGEGGDVGPDLTGYERANRTNMIPAIVDPGAAIREGFAQHQVFTRDGRSLVGIVAERDATRLTLVDPLGQRAVIPLAEIEEQRALATSIMPDGLLAGLSDRQIRDLFAYLEWKGPQ